MSTSRLLRVSVLQVAFDDLEHFDARVERIVSLIEAQKNADLVVLPELWAHGAFSPAAWTTRAQQLDGPLVRELCEVAQRMGIVLHGGSLIEAAAPGAECGAEGRGLWNTSVVLGPDGQLLRSYRKIHRFGFGEGEPLLIEAGVEPAVLDLPQGRAGLAICYDLRFPELFRELVDRGAEMFVIPASWPEPRREHWELLGRARALENQAYVIQANTVGTHGGIAMGGHSQVVDPQGAVLARAGSDEEVLEVEIDLDVVSAFREGFPVLRDRRLAGARTLTT